MSDVEKNEQVVEPVPTEPVEDKPKKKRTKKPKEEKKEEPTPAPAPAPEPTLEKFVVDEMEVKRMKALDAAPMVINRGVSKKEKKKRLVKNKSVEWD